jgi:hypothetical protein
VPIGNQRRSPPSLIKRRFAAVTDRWQSEAVTDTRLFAAVTNLWQLAAKLWHRAVRVSMFCPYGQMRLFCFDEKSSLNIYSLATTAWRSFCSLFSCLSMVACCKLLQKKNVFSMNLRCRILFENI